MRLIFPNDPLKPKCKDMIITLLVKIILIISVGLDKQTLGFQLKE